MKIVYLYSDISITLDKAIALSDLLNRVACYSLLTDEIGFSIVKSVIHFPYTLGFGRR